MRVVLVSRCPKDIDHPRGGVETATLALAKGLQANGIRDLHLVAIEHDLADIQQEDHDGLTVHRLPRSGWPMLVDVFGGPSQTRLKRYLEGMQPDIVHFHETWGFGAPGYDMPTVFTVHGFDSLNLPTEQQLFWRSRSVLWSVAERFGLKGQQRLISIAPYVTREIAPRTDADIVEIWNALSYDNFTIERQREGQKIVFLGWLNYRKNPLVIVRALARISEKFPDAELQLIGEASDPRYSTLLDDEINKSSLAGRVELTGRLPQSGVRAQLSRASVLVLPSLQENAPMVIAEAMAMGVPVIASDVCGIPDMLDENCGILLSDPHDDQELAVAIERLLADDDLNESFGQAARERATKLFHPDRVAQSTIAVYREVIEAFRQHHRKAA